MGKSPFSITMKNSKIKINNYLNMSLIDARVNLQYSRIFIEIKNVRLYKKKIL